MWFKMINDSFECENCYEKIEKHSQWWARNHCNYCLYSKHLDELFPWDRKSKCRWIMEPIWIEYKKNKWNMLKHKCAKCGKEILNKIANDDDFLSFVEKMNKNFK